RRWQRASRIACPAARRQAPAARLRSHWLPRSTRRRVSSTGPLFDVSQAAELVGDLALGFVGLQLLDLVLEAVRGELVHAAIASGLGRLLGPVVQPRVDIDLCHRDEPPLSRVGPTPSKPLVPKLQLGNAPLEAPLRRLAIPTGSSRPPRWSG